MYDPWRPWYDKCFGFVVRAESPSEARQLASKEAGDEEAIAWTDETNSTCEELTDEGEPGVIMGDVHAA